MSYFNGETVAIVLFFIGLGGLIIQRNIVKSIVGLGIMQTAIILYFIAGGFVAGSVPPIEPIAEGMTVADPLPQALMITEIVIGVGVTAASLIMFIRIYHQYGTTSWHKLKSKKSVILHTDGDDHP